MNLKKILAGAVASVMAVSTMAVCANAAMEPCEAHMFIAGAPSWYPGGDGEIINVTGNGTYTFESPDRKSTRLNSSH